jgi:hypothetical protein
MGPQGLGLLGSLLARIGGGQPALMQRFLNSPFYQTHQGANPPGAPVLATSNPVPPVMPSPVMMPGGGTTGAPLSPGAGGQHTQAFPPAPAGQSPMLPPNAATALATIAHQKAPGFSL